MTSTNGGGATMTRPTALMARLGMSHPVMQAPMAGGATTPELVAAVGSAGGLGFLAAAYLQPPQIGEAARAVRAHSSRPFGINLFAPVAPAEPAADPTRAVARIARYHAELGLPAPGLPVEAEFRFEEQLEAVLECGASALSFTFGLLPKGAMDAARARGLFLIGTATTVDEAMRLEASGVDAVISQGSEAGAHRGTFAADFGAAMVGTMALVPQVADAVGVPVIASGGIMDGRGIAAALALGASAVQLGTAFLACDECGVPEAYKAAILTARDDETRVTRAFSGRPARGIVNRFMTEVDADPASILPYPLQNALTRPLRAAAGKAGRAEFLSLWAGQGVRLVRRGQAAGLMARLAEETEAAVRRLDSAVAETHITTRPDAPRRRV